MLTSKPYNTLIHDKLIELQFWWERVTPVEIASHYRLRIRRIPSRRFRINISPCLCLQMNCRCPIRAARLVMIYRRWETPWRVKISARRALLSRRLIIAMTCDLFAATTTDEFNNNFNRGFLSNANNDVSANTTREHTYA